MPYNPDAGLEEQPHQQKMCVEQLPVGQVPPEFVKKNLFTVVFVVENECRNLARK